VKGIDPMMPFYAFSSLALLTMVGGNLLALPQRNVKRMLAYSSIAHAGYLLLGVLALLAPSRFSGDGAQAQAVAITAGASAATTTTGSAAGASVSGHGAKNVGSSYKGMTTFTVAKGGLMYEASIGGQKFNYKKK
jgi:NADH:ubiquinone oxidoreductase subunit 2 (subunit N)